MATKSQYNHVVQMMDIEHIIAQQLGTYSIVQDSPQYYTFLCPIDAMKIVSTPAPGGELVKDQ